MHFIKIKTDCVAEYISHIDISYISYTYSPILTRGTCALCSIRYRNKYIADDSVKINYSLFNTDRNNIYKN